MSNNILTKADINRSRNRWLTTAQIAFNYETMQSSSVVFALGPCLEKLYKGKPEALKKSLNTHFQFFNTQPWMGNIILSAALAIEEEGGEDAIGASGSIKTSLMGPFAGLGDSIFFVLPKTIFGAIAAYMAIEGNPTGVAICLALGFVMLGLRIKMWDIGYKQGVKFITSMQSKLNNITDAASVMGLVVVGALISSNVVAKTPWVFTVGKTGSSLQKMLDSIMPNFLPLSITMGTYWALGKKGITSSRMVWILIILAIACTAGYILG